MPNYQHSHPDQQPLRKCVECGEILDADQDFMCFECENNETEEEGE